MLTDCDLLIRVAERNYDKFLVPTTLVEADKINRTFTNEQKADLDIKTSVNKIGEVINFSQILNSMLWNNLANGESIDENIDLYADIAMLDSASNIEIDKAKKVFNIDNGAELKLLREKYDLPDGDGQKVRPRFFMHVAKRKGYYIKGKKNYKFLDTTMDYIQTIVASFSARTRKYSHLGNKPLSYVLDRSKYDKHDVNYRQIHRIEEIIRNLKNDRAVIWGNREAGLSDNEKLILSDRAAYNAIYELAKLKINYSTAYSIMRQIDDNKNWRDIKTLMFYTLLSIPNSQFYQVFDASKKPILRLKKDSESPDVEYYGVKYRHFLTNSDEKYVYSGYISQEIDDFYSKIKQKSAK